MPPRTRVISSQWDSTGIPSRAARSIATAIIPAVGTGRPSSDSATAPAFCSAAKSVNFRPSSEVEIAATGYTRALAAAALRRISSTTAAESHAGLVFGMQAREVTPAAAAD